MSYRSIIPMKHTMSTASETAVKRRKKEKSTDRLQCEFFIAKKNRYCSMTRRADSKLCAEHSTVEDNDERIPCPKDPAHSVWKKNLGKHLKKCNANRVVVITDPYFQKDLNCEVSNEPEEERLLLQDHKEELLAFISSIESKAETLFAEEIPLDDHYEQEDALKSRFEELTNQKHIIQQSSMISHLCKLGLLKDQKRLVIEFGCGRLELSRYVNKFLNSKGGFSDYWLIDRQSPRLKHEIKMAKDYYEATGKSEAEFTYPSKILRHKVDIKDVSLDGEDHFGLENYDQVFAISKHLCGVATDLTLRCCLNSKKFQDNSGTMAIAMCCRHCCSYLQLLPESKEFLLKNFQIDKYKFDNFLTKLTSWATSGSRGSSKPADEDHMHYSGLKYEQRLAIGLKARRIIDECRKYALEKRGCKVELCKYVESSVSLENHLMKVTFPCSKKLD